MRRTVLVSAAIATLALAACGDDGGGADETATGTTQEPDAAETSDEPAPDSDVEEPEGTLVTLLGTDGADTGIASFQDLDDGVRVEVDVTGLEPGFHGFHLHDVPECDPEAEDGPFTTAEGHWADEGDDHGDHTGDMPPLLVAEDGTATASFVTDRFTLAEVADRGGVAVMVHAGPDNLGNVPDRYTAEGADAAGPDEDTLATGDAGDRVACGILGTDAESS